MDPLYKIKNGFRRCPYDPSHTVSALRFIGHLLKCSQRSSLKLMVCPWNATHHVYPEYFEIHMSTCESQELLDGIGEIAIPDSAYVREYKMLQSLKNGEEDVLTVGGEVSLYYEPIDTTHDYAVEVHNRRFLTQELSTRNIDEFNTPVVTGTTRYDLYGNIIAKGEVDLLPPGGADSGDDDPDSSVGSRYELYGKGEVDSGDDGPDSSVSSRYNLCGNIDKGEVDSDDRDDSPSTEPSSNPLKNVCSDSEDPNGFVIDNHRFYYGRRLDYRDSSVHSGRQIALDIHNQIREPFTCPDKEEDRGFPTPTDGGVFTCNPKQEKRDNETVLSTTPSLQLAEGETRRRAVSRPPTTLCGERPTYALGARKGKEGNIPASPSVIPQGREGGLQPKTVTGFGRAYRLQKLYESLTQENEVSDGGETTRPSNSSGQGRGLSLQRQFAEFQLGKTSGRGKVTSSSDTGNGA